MKKNILIVGGGPEITICYDLINNSTEYNFFSVSEIPTMYPELFVETIETSFRNFGKTIEQIKELKYSIDAVACWDEALTHIADDISKELGLNPISSLDSQSFRFKDRMRMVCEAGGLKMPKYKIINQFS
ncbi:TPA: biotin carboxylase, partial [Streptococcus pyogenes]